MVDPRRAKFRNHDLCRLEYAQMWPSASAQAAVRSAPSSYVIAFPVEVAMQVSGSNRTRGYSG